MNNEQEPILIGIEEACKLMNMGRNTMLKLAKIKGFPALISSHKIWIDKQNLQPWISKNYGRFK